MYTLKDLKEEIQAIAFEYNLVFESTIFEHFLAVELGVVSLSNIGYSYRPCIITLREINNKFTLRCCQNADQIFSAITDLCDPKSKRSYQTNVERYVEFFVDINKFRTYFLPRFKQFLAELSKAQDPILNSYLKVSKDHLSIETKTFNRKNFLDNAYGKIMKECDKTAMEHQISLMYSYVFGCFLHHAVGLPIPEPLLNKRTVESDVLDFKYYQTNRFGNITLNIKGFDELAKKLKQLFIEAHGERISPYINYDPNNSLSFHTELLEELMMKFKPYLDELASYKYSNIYASLRDVSKDHILSLPVPATPKLHGLFSPVKEREKPVMHEPEAKHPRRSARLNATR